MLLSASRCVNCLLFVICCWSVLLKWGQELCEGNQHLASALTAALIWVPHFALLQNAKLSDKNESLPEN